MIAAILRAQILSLRVSSGKRGGTIFSLFTGVLFYGFWTFVAWGELLFFSSEDQSPLFISALTAGLMLAMLYWQLAPVVSASFGASLDLRKLLAYPIPHNRLFLVETLLRTITCGEMLIVVGGATLGLLRNPAYGIRVAPQILAGALIFIAMNILLSAGTRNWIERVFLKTRLKEVAIFLFAMVGLLPRLLMMMNVKMADIFRVIPSQIGWPWSAPARVMLGDPFALSFVIAAAWFTAAFVFSRWQFERALSYDAASSRLDKHPDRPVRADGFTDRIFRLPARFFSDPIAAIAEKELRTLVRIPRFRLVYLMSSFFGLVLYLPNLKRAHAGTFFDQNALLFMSTYGLLMLGQITYWNAFGFDRSAVQGYFSWPIRFRDVLIAKNLTVVMLLVPQIAVISAIASQVHIPVSLAKIAETIAVMFITALYWLAMGNICSVRMPRPLDPDKMNQMSNKMQAMTILAAPFLLIPIVIAYWCRWFFGNELVFAGLLVVAATVGGIFYKVGLESAVETAHKRRESILSELSRSDGPLSTT